MELFSYSISDPNLKYQVSRQNGSLIMNNLEDTDAGVYEFNLESSHYGNKKGKITVNVDGMYYFYFYEKLLKLRFFYSLKGCALHLLWICTSSILRGY